MASACHSAREPTRSNGEGAPTLGRYRPALGAGAARLSPVAPPERECPPLESPRKVTQPRLKRLTVRYGRGAPLLATSGRNPRRARPVHQPQVAQPQPTSQLGDDRRGIDVPVVPARGSLARPVGQLPIRPPPSIAARSAPRPHALMAPPPRCQPGEVRILCIDRRRGGWHGRYERTKKGKA